VRVLITGNMGYIGPVLVRHLRRTMPSAHLIGYDAGFFAHCLVNGDSLPEILVDEQHFGDTRNIPKSVFQGVEAVVHLAAVSNDPMGNRFERVTKEVNEDASVDIALRARDAGVRNFVFASSCSVYGFAEGQPRKETDTVSPLTAYARSKIGTEMRLRQNDMYDVVVSCLRFATACGMSPRLRLDLVLNDFVACALSSGEISVLSDGTPWRPLIDVADMARAIEWAINRKSDIGGQFLTVNVGDQTWNYRVRDLAEAVARAVPGTRISVNAAAPPDTRSYQVDFSLFRALAPSHAPQVTLHESIIRVKDGLERVGFKDVGFRDSSFMRLKVIEEHMRRGRLDAELRWKLS
jgi:nucleoside-diphosphate-sugar epimerase